VPTLKLLEGRDEALPPLGAEVGLETWLSDLWVGSWSVRPHEHIAKAPHASGLDWSGQRGRRPTSGAVFGRDEPLQVVSADCRRK